MEENVQDVIFFEVRKIISEILSVPEERITLESSFINDLGADSLDVAEIVVSLEERFHINPTDEEAGKFLCVKYVVDFIKKTKTKEGSSG